MTLPKFPLPDGYGWQYHFILWVQSFHTPWMDHVATILSYLGTESAYLFILPILFLAINRKLGLRVAYVFLTSMFVNSWLKVAFHVARPIGIPGIRSGYIKSATGLSMPSGHAQGTMTFFVALSRWLQRKLVLWLGVFLVFAIGLSRIYLGLHWPTDILVGWVLGLLLGLFGWTIGRWWTYRQVPFSLAMVFSVLFPLLLAVINRSETSLEYATFLFAIGAGSLLEKQFVHSEMNSDWWKRVCVVVISVGGMVAIQWGLQSHLIDEPWKLVRDLLIGGWTTIGAPWVFLKIGLYDLKDEDSLAA